MSKYQHLPFIWYNVDWDIESENLRLESMIIVYQEHIEILEKENKNLQNQVTFLKEQLEYKSLGYPKEEDDVEF